MKTSRAQQSQAGFERIEPAQLPRARKTARPCSSSPAASHNA
ncbi:hypothetical protein [Candidatus Chlorohelix sp.]